MSARIRMAAALASAALAAAIAAAPMTAQVFRQTTSLVSVTASVKRGNNVVPNLTTADFTLTDNGVAQTIDAITIESVPIDVTLFLDTSGSTAGKLDEMTHDVQGIVATLRPGDRFRMLTIGDAVNETVPWTPAGQKVNVAFEAVGGISLIRDALMFGLAYRVDPGRRHLVVGMTDRQDCGSVITSSQLLELAGRTETVIHLVDYSGQGTSHNRVRGCSPRARIDGVQLIDQAAERTGGELHKQSRFFRASNLLGAFKTIFSDFRQSYVLRYKPTGVDAHGWHAIAVATPKLQKVTIRARQGYYAD